jgi:hypothetical protein
MAQPENPVPSISTEVLGVALAAHALIEANQNRRGVAVFRARYRQWLELLVRLEIALTVPAADEYVTAVNELYKSSLEAAIKELSAACERGSDRSGTEDGVNFQNFSSWAIEHLGATWSEILTLVMDGHRQQTGCEASH